MLKCMPVGATLIFVGALSFGAPEARAHCDGLDGPVVTAARAALESGDVRRALIWVAEEDEAEIRAAFDETISVRDLSPGARALADRYFFETVVRIHRAGEGAPFTGLKPAGRDLGPAIPAADIAVESEAPEALEQLLTDEVLRGLHTQFEAVMEKKDFAPEDVAAGRAFVEAYVPFIHYVERLYDAAVQKPEGHFDSH
jgi:hypothetical protein